MRRKIFPTMVASAAAVAMILGPAMAASASAIGTSGAATTVDTAAAPDSAIAKILARDPRMSGPVAHKAARRANATTPSLAAPRARAAGATVPLPMTGFTAYGGAVAVDDAHQHVFIAGGEVANGGSMGIVVTDLDGTVQTTIETDTAVTGLFVDSADDTLYASLYDDNAVAAIDVSTLSETQAVAVPRQLLNESSGGRREYRLVGQWPGDVVESRNRVIAGVFAGPRQPCRGARSSRLGGGRPGAGVGLRDRPRGCVVRNAHPACPRPGQRHAGRHRGVGGWPVRLCRRHRQDLPHGRSVAGFHITPTDTISGSVATQGSTYAVGVGWYQKDASESGDLPRRWHGADRAVHAGPAAVGARHRVLPGRFSSVRRHDRRREREPRRRAGRGRDPDEHQPARAALADAGKGVSVHGTITFTNGSTTAPRGRCTSPVPTAPAATPCPTSPRTRAAPSR